MWQLIFAWHLAAAIAWWWVMPGGFPWQNVRTWSNGVLPWVIVAGAAAGFRGLVRRRAEPTASLIAAVPILWAAVVATACVLYPVSARRFGPPGVGIVAVLAAAWWFLSPMAERGARSQRWTWLVAAALGAFYAWSIRSDPPATHPLDVLPPDFTHIAGGDAEVDALLRGGYVHLVPGTGEVVYAAEGVMIHVQPLLTFESRSPDRCWTVYAPPNDRSGPPRQFVGRRSIDDVALLRYLDDGAHIIRVRSRREAKLCEIEGYSSYPRDVYSDRNYFCRVRLLSRHALRLTFSPCPHTPVAARRFADPTTAPAQFGYLRDDGAFVLVEAHRGETGPYQTLAEGPLGRDGALRVMIEYDGLPAATLIFDDWAAQASTALSPTAGWGVPQNAVEFQRSEGDGEAIVEFWLTLAGSSIGRGFDSVGHKAGTYRNRMRIEVPE